MSLPFDEAMARIAEVQKGLSITSYVDFDSENDVVRTNSQIVEVKRAYTYFPRSDSPPKEFPCFINQWEETETTYQPGGWISATSTVHMQLLMGLVAPETDRKAAIAIAFYPKVLTAFAALKLGGWGPITVRGLRSGAIPAILNYGEIGYVGLDLFLDIYLAKAQVLAP